MPTRASFFLFHGQSSREENKDRGAKGQFMFYYGSLSSFIFHRIYIRDPKHCDRGNKMREHYHIMIMNDFLIQSNFNLIYMCTIFLNKLRELFSFD